MAELDGVLFKEIVEHGLREFPNECCGLVAAEGDAPIKVFPMTNADASPATYRFDATEQLKVFGELEDRGWEIWGIYHSHTHSKASPSPTDTKRAFYPEARYLVLSLKDRAAPVMGSFWIRDGVVTEEELVIR